MTPRQFISSLAQWSDVALKSDEQKALIDSFTYRNRVDYASFARRVCKFPSDAHPCMRWIRSKLWSSGVSLWFLFRPVKDSTVSREQFRATLERALGPGALKEDDFGSLCRAYARGNDGRVDSAAACRDARPTLEDVQAVVGGMENMLKDVRFIRGHAGGMEAYFEPYDWDASGTVSRSRFKECCRKASLLMNDREAQILVEFLDPRGDNRVDYTTFCAMLLNAESGGSSEDSTAVRDYFLRHGREFICALARHDKRRSGFVTEEQFFSACRDMPVDPDKLRMLCGIHNAVGSTVYGEETLRFVAYEHFMKKSTVGSGYWERDRSPF